MKNQKKMGSGEADLFSFASRNEMEDLVSDSRYAKKKKLRFKKKPTKFRRWWSQLQRWKKVTIVLLLTVTILVGGLWGVLKYIYNKYVYEGMTDDFGELGIEKVIDQDIMNVALFGIDTRNINVKSEESFKGLSDSIMIMSIDTKDKEVKVISVMRDSLVPIDNGNGKKYAKINSAYATGGAKLAVKTLNQIFGLDIREYATVNFAGMADIIDAVGGIEVTLADGELDVFGYENGVKINWGLNGLIAEQCSLLGKDASKLYIKKGGTYHLNGIQAVAYARIRHAANVQGTNNDYGRTDRQRYVMEQLFNKAIKLGKSEYFKLAKAMLPCCKTSLEFEKVVALANNVLSASPTFHQTRVPLNEYQMPSSTHVYYDLDYAGELIHAFIYDDITPEDYMKTNGIRKNDWYAKIGKGTGKASTSPTPDDETDQPLEEFPSEYTVSEAEKPNNTSSDPATNPKPETENGSTSSTTSEQENTEDDKEPKETKPSTTDPAEKPETQEPGDSGDPPKTQDSAQP